MVRHGEQQGPSLTRVALVVGCVALFYAIFVPLRLVEHDALWFVHPGRVFISSAHSSKVISSTRWDRRVGYDGELYYGLAADPAHADDYIGAQAGVVYSRVGYPALAFVASAGSVGALPVAMLAINLIAILVATAAIALWLIRRRVPPWPAALYGLFPGVIFTAFFDLTEPLAFAFVTLAVLCLDGRTRRWTATAAVLFACAVLTRETTVPFALAGAACVGWRGRSSLRRALLRAVGFAAATCVPLLLWRVVVAAYTGKPTQETTHTPLWYIPLRGFWDWRPLDGEHRLILFAVVLPALGAGCAALVLLARRRAPIPAALLLVNVLLYVVYLPKGVYIDYPAAGRAVIGVLVAAFYCLPAWWGRRPAVRLALAVEAFACSLAWYSLVAWKYGLPTIDALTT